MTQRRRAAVLVVAGLAGVAGAAPTNESAYTMDEIVVRASPARESVLLSPADILQTVDRDSIDVIQPNSAGELLEYVPGVAVETGTGSGHPDRSIVSLNGLPAQYTLVLVDGVPLITEHIHSGQNIDFIPPQMIERIEILRGAASGQYGADAIGGVVNIVTRKCADTAEGELRVSGGSYDTYEGGLSLLYPVSRTVRLSNSLNWEQSDGAEITAPANRVGKMGYDRFSWLGRVDGELDRDTRAYSWVNYVDSTMDWQTGEADSRLVTPVAGLTHDFTDALAMGGRVSYADWEADASEESDERLEPEVNVTWRTSEENTLSGGVSYKRSEFERSATVRHDRDDYALYAQDEIWLTRKLAVMGAVRGDEIEDVETAVSPKVSVLYAPAEAVALRGSVGRGFHAPTLMELYEEGYGHGGRAYRFGNPDLEPEYSTAYTFGLDVQPLAAVRLWAAGYYTDFEDMIVPVYQGPWEKDPAIDVWRRTNIESAHVYGGECGARIKLGEAWRIDAAYDRTESEDEETGRRLPYHSGSSVSGTLAFRQGLPRKLALTSYVGVRSVFDREAWNWKPAAGAAADSPDGLTTPLGDYTQMDAGTTLTLAQGHEIFLKVENIFGEDIENLDDAYTVIDGEPVVTVGLVTKLPL